MSAKTFGDEFEFMVVCEHPEGAFTQPCGTDESHAWNIHRGLSASHESVRMFRRRVSVGWVEVEPATQQETDHA